MDRDIVDLQERVERLEAKNAQLLEKLNEVIAALHDHHHSLRTHQECGCCYNDEETTSAQGVKTEYL